MLDNVADRLGRYLLASIFLKSAIDKARDFSGSERRLEEQGVALTKPVLFTSISVEGLGALSLIADYYPKVGSAMLIVFLVITTFMFHNPFQEGQRETAFKNAAILGGLLHYYSTNTGFNKHGA